MTDDDAPLVDEAPERPADIAPKKTGWTEARRQAQRDRLSAMRAEGKMSGRRSKASSVKPDRKPTTARAKPLKPRLLNAYETLGAVVGLVSPADGQLILDNSEKCASAVAEWADSDPRVKAALDRLLSTSAVGKVLAAHLPIGIGIALNHGMVPGAVASLFGAGPSADRQITPDQVEALARQSTTEHMWRSTCEAHGFNDEILTYGMQFVSSAAPPAAA